MRLQTLRIPPALRDVTPAAATTKLAERMAAKIEELKRADKYIADGGGRWPKAKA